MGNVVLLFLFSVFCFGDTGSLRKVRGGLIIKATDVNQYRTALKGTVFTRNSSGAVVDQFEGLGSSSFRWDDSYIKRLVFGAYANNIYIENTGTNIEMNVGGAVQMQITSNGLDGNYIKNDSIAQAGLATKVYTLGSTIDFNTSSTGTWTAVTNGTATLTPQRNGVRIMLVSANTAIGCYFGVVGSGSRDGRARIKRDGTVIFTTILLSGDTGADLIQPCGIIKTFDNVTGGSSITYTLEIYAGTSDTTTVYQAKLLAVEI